MQYRMESGVKLFVFCLFIISVGATIRQPLLLSKTSNGDKLQELWEENSKYTSDDIYRNKYLLEEWKLNRTVPYKISLILRNSFNHSLFRIFFSAPSATNMSLLTSVLNGSHLMQTTFTRITEEVDTMFGSATIPFSIRRRSDSLKAYFAIVNAYNVIKLLFLKNEQTPFGIGNSIISTTYQYCVEYFSGFEAIVSRSSEDLTSIDSCAWFCNNTSSFAVQTTGSMIICECVLGSTSITQHIVHDIKCLDFTCKDENNDDQPCGMSSAKAFYSHDVINFDSTNVMLINTVANLADHEYSKTFTVEIGNGKGENKIISGVLLSEINFGISNFTFEFSGESCSYNDSFQRYTEFDLKVFEASTVHVIEPLRTSCIRLTIYPSGDTPADNPRCRITLYEPYDDYVTAERIGIYGYYHNSEIDTSDIYTADYLTSSLNDYSSMSTEQVSSQITTQMPVSSEIGFTMITSQLETNNLPSSHMDTAALTISQLGTSILPSSHMDTAALTISQLGTSILPTSHMDTATLIASQGITGTTSSTTVYADDHTPTAEKTTEAVNSQGNLDNLTCFSFCYHKYHSNLTAEQVENIRDEIRQLLLVDTKTLSSQIRRKISVKDKRPSATIIGTIPIVILLALLGCIVLSDLNTIRRQVYCMVKNFKGLYSSI